RPRDRQRHHDRKTQARSGINRDRKRAGRINCEDPGQKKHRQHRHSEADTGEVVQRENDPVDRADIAGETLQPRVEKNLTRLQTNQRIEKRHEGDPREQAQVEFRKGGREGEAAKQCEGDASGGGHRWCCRAVKGSCPARSVLRTALSSWRKLRGAAGIVRARRRTLSNTAAAPKGKSLSGQREKMVER